MTGNRFYMVCPLARQMLTESTGEDWSNASYSDIVTEVPGLKPFASWWKTTHTHLTDIDKLMQEIDTQIRKLSGAEGLVPPASVPQLVHYKGTFSGPFGKVCSTFRVTTDSGVFTVAIDNATKLQKCFFTENEEIHIYVSQDFTAHYVITDDAYRALQYYHGQKVKECFIKDYLKLSFNEQLAVNALALRGDIRKSVLYAMAYCASAFTTLKNEFNDKNLKSVGSEYNNSVAPRMGCIPIPGAWFSIYAHLLYEDDLTDRFRLSTTLPTMRLYSLVNGCYPWNSARQSRVSELLRVFPSHTLRGVEGHLIRLVTPDRVQSFLDDVFAYLSSEAGGQDAINIWLLELLRYHKHLTLIQIGKISHALFRHTIHSDQIDSMHALLHGPSGKYFRSFIMESFYNGCRAGTAEYNFCAATILNFERAERGECPVACAIAGMEAATDPADFLLNSQCLGMLAWYPKIHQKTYRTQLKDAALDHALIERLTALLLHPDKLNFPIAASVLHDLIIAGIISSDILTDQVRCSALSALRDSDTRRRAEEILSLTAFPEAEATGSEREERLSLISEYQQKFEASLKDTTCDDPPEFLFCVLCHLNAWETKEAHWAVLNRICHYYSNNPACVFRETVLRMNRLLAHFAPNPQFWAVHATQVDPETLGTPLTEKERQQITDLCQLLEHSGAAEYTVSTTEEALRIVKYLTPYENPVLRRSDHSAGMLLEKIRLKVPSPGSFLVVSWFRLLCCFGCADLALQFYREHKSILDLPNFVQSAPSTSSSIVLFKAYRQFIRSEKRVVAGIYHAVQAGHLSVLSAFMNSEFKELVDCKEFVRPLFHRCKGDFLEHLSEIYNGRHGLDAASRDSNVISSIMQNELSNLVLEVQELLNRLKIELPESDLSNVPSQNSENESCREASAAGTPDGPILEKEDDWPSYTKESAGYSPHHYYDDRTILEFNLIHHPDQHWDVLQLGYQDDYHMVFLAVSYDGASLRFASPALKENHSICLRALQNSGYALAYVKGDMIHDFANVKALLLSSAFTLENMPEPYCSDRDLILAAVKRNPAEFQYAKPCFRTDYSIAREALQQARTDPSDPFAIEFLDAEMTNDKELMLMAVRANPEAYTYISQRLKKDPDILALPHSVSAKDILSPDYTSLWDDMS